MRRHLIATALATALIASTTGALAAYTAPATTLTGVTSGNYTVDGSHTNVLFNLTHMGFSRYYGRFNKVDGTLKFDAANPEKSTLAITIDAASVDTNNAKLEEELKGAQWFDAAKFPTITFTSTSVKKLTDTTGQVSGNLTLHGVTKPVTLSVTFNGAGKNPIMGAEQLGFSATAAIKRSDFGVSQYVPMVGDDVTLTIESELHLAK
ncbi:MAG: YceI family protein [Pseudomonadota bacterium]